MKTSQADIKLVVLLAALLVCTLPGESSAAEAEDISLTPPPNVLSNHDQAIKAHRAKLHALEAAAATNVNNSRSPVIGQKALTLDQSLVKDTNAISGPATNGCQLFLRLGTNAVPAGDPITVHVIIQNGSDQGIFYSLSSMEIPWFCEFTVLDERGEKFSPIARARPYFWNDAGGGIPSGNQYEYEIRLDRIYSFTTEGKYSIYAKKVFSWARSGKQSKVTAGPAILRVVKKKEGD